MLQWVLVIKVLALIKLNQIFYVSSIKLFLKVVALEKIRVSSKTSINWHGDDVLLDLKKR